MGKGRKAAVLLRGTWNHPNPTPYSPLSNDTRAWPLLLAAPDGVGKHTLSLSWPFTSS